jgi:hypothetical protein
MLVIRIFRILIIVQVTIILKSSLLVEEKGNQGKEGWNFEAASVWALIHMPV